jgi:hypothetical protein
MKRKDLKRWVRKNLRLVAAILVAVGIAGSAFGVGYYRGAEHAGHFYNETISELNSHCIYLQDADSSIKRTLTHQHGDEGVYRPEDWTIPNQ